MGDKETPESEEKNTQTEADKKLLTKIRDRYKVMLDADEENRRLAMEDLKFVNVPGAQWDNNMKQERGSRPCYEFNKLRITGKRVINEMRANRPQGKVRGVEDGDKETADVYEGLIRNIWNTSDGDSVIDQAAEYQVNGGMAAWRITTDYAGDNAFDQDIKIEPIHNPLCLYCDPSAKDQLKRDAEDWILTEKISKTSFKEKYPNIEAIDWEDSEFDDDDDWSDDDQVRIAEYWWKEPVEKEIWQLTDGKVVDSESDEAAEIPEEQIKARRTIKTHIIKMCIASGNGIIEQPVEQAGKEHRFVMIYGEYVLIDGKAYWFGLPRFAKDAQRSYNVTRTAITETIAQTPQAKWWATTEQAEGHTEKWAEAHKKNFPFLLHNSDPKNPGPPRRMGGADVPIALIQESQIASDEIKDVTGINDASLGRNGNETSGVAIRARAAQGDMATFNYQDNMGKGIRRTWEILIDLIPQIYDTERTLRVLGTDGAEDYVKINTFVKGDDGENIKVHDMATGRYDVTVTIGPSFSTRREEASETYSRLAQGNPEIMGVAGDLIFKSMDLPYSEDIADRLRAMLPPQIQQIINKDAPMPPEAQAMMQQANQAMQQVEQQMQAVQQAGQEVEQGKAEADKAKSEVQQLIANLKTDEARFEAKIAKELAKVAERQSNVKMGELQRASEVDHDEIGQDRELLAQQISQSTQAINQMSAEFMQQAIAAIGEIKQHQEGIKPKVIRIESERVNGKLVATPVYEEGVTQ